MYKLGCSDQSDHARNWFPHAGGCGVSGVCLSVPGRIGANTAPTITLKTNILLPTYNLTFGTTYAACAAGVQPTLAKLCEPGCSAGDTQNGNLTNKVVACPSAGCRNSSILCSGTCKEIPFFVMLVTVHGILKHGALPWHTFYCKQILLLSH